MTGPHLIPPSRRAVLAGAFGCALAGRPARAATPATRIASLGGAVTEILWRLGAGPRIAIVDTTSVYPAEVLRERPNAGYLRALSAEGLLSVGPDLVLAAEGAGPPAVLALLREAGVPVETIREPSTAEGVLDKIATVGRLAGLEAPAETLSRAVAARFATLAGQRARVTRPARALVVLSQTGGRVMVGGRGSTADGILALAGLVNAAEGIEGFKPITDEAIVGAAPDAVIMMVTEGRTPTPEGVFASGTALAQTPAAARRALVTMDGLALLGYGPRTPEAAADLMRAIYPDLPRD
ncbi:hemin ABC transporter substrate-binding protein [Methylobacterium sp. Leaf102]|uniref:heme/hemin ABC transporter substrate-binding protein n=1 Tax=unclassified Methylobacterium TaxID=2615210 RepID=UPI00070137A8|nr:MULTISPECIES: ABC transporter substrate-binding protein [unclassified Methylobacterium]KQP26628.1 hemin ABC transporter substrate-binding protein [Methylobacterium sp. Leaf100]KQP28167.1 hemin ABC transporter substrate-binding protein [Methylobacterium sp. Leaf102]